MYLLVPGEAEMHYSRDFKVVAGLLCLTLAFGGAGINFPSLETLLQAVALGVLGYFAMTARVWRFNMLTTLALALLVLTTLLPLLQLVPLPPAAWQALPGRELPAELDNILGWHRWRPWTLDVEATIRSFLRLLPPAVIFLGCMFLSHRERSQLLRVVIGFALVGALLGIIQLVTRGWLTPFPSGHFGYPIGLFVNRNHQAAFLLAAMPICAALFAVEIERGRPPVPMVIAALSTLIIMAVVVIGTTSRMGFVLLPIAVAGSLLLLLRRHAPWRLAVPAIGAVVAIGGFLVITGKFTQTLSRFSSLDDARLGYWSDIQWALQQYGLAGTGIGTFIPVFQTAESLEAVTPAITNHAHNDYLELLLGGGAAAVVLLLIFIGLLGVATFRASRSRQSGERAAISVAAAVSIGILLLASLVDYPLRMPAIGAMLALLCAVLLPTKPPAQSGAARSLVVRGRSRTRSRSFWITRSAVLAVIAVLSVVAVQAGGSARALLSEQYDSAASWAPWSTEAHERLATAALLRSDADEALAQAFAAARLSPISAPAIRTIGLIRSAQGSRRDGGRVMQIAATLGWRDPITQLWAIDTAERSGEADKAMQRADALFRQETFVVPALAQLLRAPPGDNMLGKLVATLAGRPSWREKLFEISAQLPNRDVPALEAIVGGLGKTKAPATMEEMQPLLDSLIARGNIAAAQRIWARLHTGNLVTNGSFELFDDSRSRAQPQSWTVDSEDMSRVTVEEMNGRNHALRILSSRGTAVLYQDLMLPPGSYSFTYDARVSSGSEVLLRWELRCRNSVTVQTLETSLTASSNWRESGLSFTVPNRDCPIQRLALRRVRANDAQEVWLDNLKLSRIVR